MLDLLAFMDRAVLVCCNDGRIIVGIMKGFDQSTNIILSDSHERVFSRTEPVQAVPLGAFLLRGDSVAAIGELDNEKDKLIDYQSLKADSLPPILHD